MQAAPGSTIRKAIRARKVTSQIEVHVTSSDPAFTSAYARATTTVDGEKFSVSVPGPQDFILPVFNGDWNVRVSAYPQGGGPVELPVKVTSTNQIVHLDFPQTAPQGTVSGRIVDENGEAFPTFANLFGNEPGPMVPFVPVSSLNLVAREGDWRFAIEISPRTDIVDLSRDQTYLTYYLTNILHTS